jgi:hypothetical protein
LLDVAFDADELQAAAQDLRQRSQYYGVALEIGPVLDRVNDLRHQAGERPDWPPLDTEDDTADGMSLHQIFAQLGIDDTD